MTKVIFRKHPHYNEVVAFFPDTLQHGTMDSYAHVGQHSPADIGYYQETIPASESESSELLKELVSIGYDDLTIRKKITYAK